ncbi:MAG: hypothetical protein ACRC37_00395, partial [Lentisphaeria bacterium]
FSIHRKTVTLPSAEGTLRSKATFDTFINGEEKDNLGKNCELFASLIGRSEIFSVAENKVIRIIYPLFSKSYVPRNIEVLISKDAAELKELISIGKELEF